MDYEDECPRCGGIVEIDGFYTHDPVDWMECPHCDALLAVEWERDVEGDGVWTTIVLRARLVEVE